MDLARNVQEVGGLDQFHAYRLFYNQSRSSVVLRTSQSHGWATTRWRCAPNASQLLRSVKARQRLSSGRVANSWARLPAGNMAQSILCMTSTRGVRLLIVTLGRHGVADASPACPGTQSQSGLWEPAVLSVVRNGQERTRCCEKCHSERRSRVRRRSSSGFQFLRGIAMRHDGGFDRPRR